MEGEKKNSTALLTVIAIATLLVAVVGATFAYFSASADTSQGNVTVQATTAAANDQLVVTGNTNMSLSITADTMQQPESTTVATHSEGDLTVSLTAGSSKATCTYDLVYNVSTAFTQSAANTGSTLEYGLTGDCTSSNTTLAACDTKDFTGNNAKDLKGSSQIVLVDDATIVDEYDEGAGAGEQSATTHDWDFSAIFYNLTVAQDDQIGKTFGGTISATDIHCSNSNS